MGVPKRKRSRQRRDKRFANKGLKVKAIATCQNCQEALPAHQACKKCGFYKGAKVLVTKADRLVSRGKTRMLQAQKAQAREPKPQQEQ